MLVISDEVYKYMVYEGLGAGGEGEEPSSLVPEAAAAALHAAKSASAAPPAINGSGKPAGVLQPESEGGSSAAREAPPTEPAKKADDVGAVEPLPALRHVHFATLPGMWDRTITISSAGKTFSVTGWQVRMTLPSVFFWCFFGGRGSAEAAFSRVGLLLYVLLSPLHLHTFAHRSLPPLSPSADGVYWCVVSLPGRLVPVPSLRSPAHNRLCIPRQSAGVEHALGGTCTHGSTGT